ncbi:hypothetical protein C8J56DRAFT_916259 [Mycena floridula]|nr:hypothetical protein C8J56DRAFT_916259 [Mycena floridula]
MSSFFPHSEYAEDQPLARTILTSHVLYRGAQSGALIGSFMGAARHFIKRPVQPFTTTLLRSTGIGTLVGTGFLTLALAGRMYDKTEIEWSDRSWRLLENKRQVEVDDWSLLGTMAGAGAASFRAGRLGFRGVLGGASLGSLLGVAGFMVSSSTN